MPSLSDYFPGFDNWQSASGPAAAQKPAIADPTTTPNPYLRANLPLSLMYSPDSLRQFNKAGLSSFRISPTSQAANPSANAAIQNISETVSTTAVASMVSIGLEMPPIFSVNGSPAGNNGTFVVTTNNETAGYAWSVPNTSTGLSDVDVVGTNTGSTDPISVTFTTSAGPEWAFYIAFSNGGLIQQVGGAWTNQVTEGGIPPSNAFQAASLLYANPYTITFDNHFNGTPALWAAQTVVFGVLPGVTPSVLQTANTLNLSTQQIVMGSNTTSGSSMLVAFAGITGGLGVPQVTVTDNLDNTYTLIKQSGSGTGSGQVVIYTYLATNIVGGATTITFDYTPFDVDGGQYAWEIQGIGPVMGQPIFRPLFYQSVEAEGLALPPRQTLNFLSPFITADDETNDSTDISLPPLFQLTQATVDFGSDSGPITRAYDAAVTVAAPWVSSTSKILCSMAGIATATHGVDDALVEGLIPVVDNLNPGTGFTIRCYSPLGSFGTYKINAIGL